MHIFCILFYSFTAFPVNLTSVVILATADSYHSYLGLLYSSIDYHLYSIDNKKYTIYQLTRKS